MSDSSQDHLAPPDALNARARRKRGLSLRSQLFNKALASLLPAPPQQSQPIEMGNMANRERSPTLASTPEITVASADEDDHPGAFYPDTKGNLSYNVTHQSISRSTTHLTTASSNESRATSFDTPRSRKLLLRRRSRASLSATLWRIRDKILGKSEFTSTERGRVIPLCVSKENANVIFNDEYYNSNAKQYTDERTGDGYCDNSITSSKYNIYTFLPKQLQAQFSKIANCYFLVVAIMQMIPSWSTTGKYTTIVPLMIFVSISIAREGFDDWKRHGHDKEENNKMTKVVREDHEMSLYDTHSITTIMTETIPVGEEEEEQEQSASMASFLDGSTNIFLNRTIMSRYNLKLYATKWKNLQVGDIAYLKEGDWVPADLVLLAVEGDEAYVETMALDGETNLKSKFAHVELSKQALKPSSLKNIRSIITVEDPNPDLYKFEGHFSVGGEDFALDSDNVIYRGSILRNTRAILGLVVFTGEETKIRMNNLKNPRVKAPKLQKNINYIVFFMVVVVLTLSAFSLMAQRLFYDKEKRKMWYLEEETANVASTFMSFVIMYNTLIPLSLYVTMEIIKVMQLLFLQFDIDMYHVETNTPADAKTATILEELGQVSYIFSDKTGTLTDNKMVFRKFSVCGSNWIHEVDLIAKEREDPSFGESVIGKANANQPFPTAHELSPTHSTTSVVRDSMELTSVRSHTTWRSTANPNKEQILPTSLFLLKYIQLHPQTLFAKKVTFFLLSIALCHTCVTRRDNKNASNNTSNYSLNDIEDDEPTDIEEDSSIIYQAASPDELALVQAARDLGFIVLDKQNSVLKVKTYPKGFDQPAKLENYEILDVIEFTSVRKRMSIVVRFPDSRVGVFCKGADNIILERLKDAELAKQKARDISLRSTDRKNMEAELILQNKVSIEAESRRSTSSLRGSIEMARRFGSLDGMVTKEESEVNDIATKARESLHIQQAKRYSIDSHGLTQESFVPIDKLLVNEEYVIEKTLEHIEEFSTEGLRTLLYSFRWMSATEYDQWSEEYREAKIALIDRSKKLEEVGEKIEINLQLLGATAIEDKLQEGVSEAIEKLRRAGIKMWMLTGDKRETAINIGYSCRLIKDYSTVVILSYDEGSEKLAHRITDASRKVKSGSIAHCVVVIDGGTLTEIEGDPTMFSLFIDLCIDVDSAICCRASPSQKASMINAVRKIKTKEVTLAIGDGANDIAMIQSADIGVGITGKEGLQAARSADYAIAQFRFLIKLLLVNGRYNYVRTSKFVLTTFYKELLFYLTQCVFQRFTLFTGTSLYESWSLSMFNTLFTSLAVICIGMFDKDLRPATLIAVPELYSTGRLYRAFNLKIFLYYMVLGAFQSVAISFLAYYTWGFSALDDNDLLSVGMCVYYGLVIVINGKIQFLEMRNKPWMAFASFFISVLGFGLWNVLIMGLHRGGSVVIYYADYGLLHYGKDVTWWATILLLFTVLLTFDLLVKAFKFIISPNDVELFQLFEKSTELRRAFEHTAYPELHQGWTFTRDASTTGNRLHSLFNKLFGMEMESDIAAAVEDENLASAIYRKRSGTNPLDTELPPSGEGVVIKESDFEYPDLAGYEILPSGAKVKVKKDGFVTKLEKRIRGQKEEVDADKIIEDRLQGLESRE